MFTFVLTIFFIFAESASEAKAAGGFNEFYETYLNYPGFEAWKFINLAIFVALLVYLLRKPLSNAFKARREIIRAELVKAQQERDAAMSKLNETEARLARLDSEVADVRKNSQHEAEAEESRIAAQTEAEITKIREQAKRELASSTQAAKQELRKYSAEESIRLAEEMIRKNLQNADSERLVSASINGLGGAK